VNALSCRASKIKQVIGVQITDKGMGKIPQPIVTRLSVEIMRFYGDISNIHRPHRCCPHIDNTILIL
jgi:hypothetical protein